MPLTLHLRPGLTQSRRLYNNNQNLAILIRTIPCMTDQATKFSVHYAEITPFSTQNTLIIIKFSTTVTHYFTVNFLYFISIMRINVRTRIYLYRKHSNILNKNLGCKIHSLPLHRRVIQLECILEISMLFITLVLA
jgi:hypothetical protein